MSVPKEWAEERALAAGATVDLYTHVDGSLVVRTEQDGDELAETRIGIEDYDPATIRAELAGAHRAGFDAIAIEASGPLTEAQRHALENAVRELPGMEITESGADATEMRARNLRDATEFSVRQSVVQVQFIALTTLRRATDALVEGDGDAVEQLRERADDADRRCGVIERHFNRALTSFEALDRLDLTRSELFDYYDTAEELDLIADESVSIGGVAASLSGPLPDDIATEFRALADAVLTVAENAVTAMLSADRAGVRGVIDDCEAAAATVRRLERRLSETDEFGVPADGVTLRRALDSLDRVIDGVRDIAGVAIRRARRAETE